MNWAIIIAIISPIIFGFMNTFDKFVVAHKVKNTLGYSAVTGIVNVIFGLVLIFFLNWDNTNLSLLIFPILAGFFYGICYYLYFFIMKNHDASYFIGFIYLFPIVVAILSFIFLNERLSVLGYIATILVLTGVILLSVRAKKIKIAMLFLPLFLYILFLGGSEFFIKVSTNNFTFMQGLAIAVLVTGITILCGLFNRQIRKGFVSELKNIKWAFLVESFTLIGTLTLFLAMSFLSATIVTSISSIQPLAVIFFERIAHRHFGKMTKDLELGPKLIAILFIVAGVIIFSIISS